MAKKHVEKDVQDIKDLLKKKNLVIGTERTLKLAKASKISKAYVSSNCPETVKDDLQQYSSIAKFDIVHVKQNNEELGILCKKPFHISLISLRKGE